jgi:hypothetical protein
MPTIYREQGFRFVIYADDHPPPHVHVIKAGNEMIIEFEGTVRIRDNWGFTTREQAIAKLIAVDNVTTFTNEWRQIHG